MNTIPLIFNERQINRTVLGGREQIPNASMDVSVILLNKGGIQFRASVLEELLKCGFQSIISVEPNSDSFNMGDITNRFPSVKFIAPLEQVTDGDMINTCMSEVKSSYVLVLRDSLRIPSGILLPRLADHLTKSGIYCVAPRLTDNAGGSILIRFAPYAEKSHLRTEASSVVTEGMPTLYPFDYIGLYNREKFIQLGGYDYTITSPYFQNLDLSVRSWLWGEQTELSTSFQISYEGEVPVEDHTVDVSSLHFYLKNLVPRYKNDHGAISESSFIHFLAASSCGFFEARRQFCDARRWVNTNKYRFRMDIQYLIEHWGAEK